MNNDAREEEVKGSGSELETTPKKKNRVSHWQIIKPVNRYIYTAMVLGGISIVTATFAILCLGLSVQSLIDGYRGVAWKWFFGAFVLEAITYIVRGSSFKISHLGAFALEVKLRQQLTKHLASVPLGVIHQIGSGGLSKVIQDDVSELHVFVADSTPLYARAAVSPILSAILMFIIDWRFALVAIGVLVVGMIIMSLTFKDSEEMGRQYNQSKEDLTQSVVEFTQAMPVVRTFDGGIASFGRYEEALRRFKDVVLYWYKLSGLSTRIGRIIVNPIVTLIVMVWANIIFLSMGIFSLKGFFLSLLLGTGMVESMFPIIALSHLLDRAKLSIERIHEIQSLKPLVVVKEPKEPSNHSIQFHNVSFKYEDRKTYALKDLSFEIKEHTMTALVGPSGAGKTTVARLIPRFWDVTEGRITIGGVDVREMDPDRLMQRIAFVFQDNFLFSGTIADNIRLGLPDKSMDDVIRAAKLAQAHEFIESLPNGYDTEVVERGNSLSGGQRQRVTIARAILQDRPIIILDEATAFSDAENEALIMEGLRALMKNKTVIMIAHRLATIQSADQVLMFKDGRLVEGGSIPELKEKEGGAFQQLWEAYEKAQNWNLSTHMEVA